MINKLYKSRWIPVLFALLMMANNASGQNFIRETTSINDDHSLIRRITDTSWIVYSRTKGENIFLRAYKTTNSASYLKLNENNIEITDFEVFHDTVFFCGTKPGVKPCAVFGMFPLAGFPACSVYYHYFSDLKSFDKIAMLSSSGKTHAAMTASYLGGYGTMVDIYKTSSSWYYCVANRENMRDMYDDVAVLNNYVVYSSRAYVGSSAPKYGRAQFVYHSLPAAPTSTVLSTTPLLRYFSSMQATSPILLDAEYDLLITATTTSNSKISVGHFSELNYYASAETATQSGLEIRDLGFNDLNLETELLVTIQNATMTGSLIYHFEDYHFMYNYILYSHYYVNQFLYSLVKAGFNDMLHVSCGHNLTNPGLRIYRYKYTDDDVCVVGRTLSSDFVHYVVLSDELQETLLPSPITLSVMEHDNYSTLFQTICPTKDEQ